MVKYESHGVCKLCSMPVRSKGLCYSHWRDNCQEEYRIHMSKRRSREPVQRKIKMDNPLYANKQRERGRINDRRRRQRVINDPERKRKYEEYHRTYRLDNADEIRAKERERYHNIKDGQEYREYKRKYRAENKCYLDASLREWHANNPDYYREYRAKNPEIYKAINRTAYYKTKNKLMDILGQHSCVNGCKVDPRILQFDHINGEGREDQKRFGNNARMYVYYSRHPEEARAKLQVMCPNCNALKRLTNDELPYYVARKDPHYVNPLEWKFIDIIRNESQAQNSSN